MLDLGRKGAAPKPCGKKSVRKFVRLIVAPGPSGCQLVAGFILTAILGIVGAFVATTLDKPSGGIVREREQD